MTKSNYPRSYIPQIIRYISRTPPVAIQVEDDRTGTSQQTLRRAFADNLFYLQGKAANWATPYDIYMALSYTVRDRLLQRWIKTVEQAYFSPTTKVVCYLSAEFLIGRQLGKNLINVGIYEKARQVVKEAGYNLYDILEQENEPALGNGGLGRLAACYLECLSSLEIPAIGYGLRYEFGIFEQAIEKGWQIEHPERWLRFGNPWEIPRPEYTVEVKLGGHTESYTDESGQYRVRWIPDRTVLGTPYDFPISGYNSNTVNTLRLWSAKASNDFHFQIFNSGDFAHAVADKTFSETITKVLYPNDNIYQGRELRLQQQYFFVSCSLQDIIHTYLRSHQDFKAFPERVALQINDTHPAIGIAELMRLLIDEHQLEWEFAWEITQKTFAFTNHTLLPEALERWSVNLFGRLFPRHLQIIYEINQRFLNEVRLKYSADEGQIQRLSLIEEGHEKQVRMANLAIVGSHTVNGVAALHTELLKLELFRDFYDLWPDKFQNKTNGITPRRWLLLANPKLALLITERLGKDWIKDLWELKKLEPLVEDAEFCDRWRQVKQDNKNDLAEYIHQVTGITVNANSLFDVQVKRIHEYKRQLLSLLHVITLYNQIKRNPSLNVVPRTVIFAGKAAPGYFMAKLIIKLINSVADKINSDSTIGDRIKIVFLPNFNVTLGERIYPAADLSEQISTAGKEASGTGNMKFALNGAVTIGTLDGANIEIREAVGYSNFFLFGLTSTEVMDFKHSGYNPRHFYRENEELREAIDQIANGYFSEGDRNLFYPLINALLNRDEYFIFADYSDYIEAQKRVNLAYQNVENWTKMSILNSARIGYFSGDRAIQEYAEDIWKVKPAPISLDPYRQENAGIQGES
ncbi:MAG: glycogen/starch/alpha-glucan phosphorylase [Chroococcales cyanobacterium]